MIAITHNTPNTHTAAQTNLCHNECIVCALLSFDTRADSQHSCSVAFSLHAYQFLQLDLQLLEVWQQHPACDELDLSTQPQ